MPGLRAPLEGRTDRASFLPSSLGRDIPEAAPSAPAQTFHGPPYPVSYAGQKID
jgi:hypothetical protein